MTTEQTNKREPRTPPDLRMARWVGGGVLFGIMVGKAGELLSEPIFDAPAPPGTVALGGLCGLVAGYYQGRRSYYR